MSCNVNNRLPILVTGYLKENLNVYMPDGIIKIIIMFCNINSRLWKDITPLKLNNLLNWMIFHGCRMKSIDMPNDMSGLRARNNIFKGDIICQIPRHCLITLEIAKECYLSRPVINSNVDIGGTHIYFALFLLNEIKLGIASHYYYYIQTLPTNFNEIPIFWDENMVKKYLNGSRVLRMIESRIILWSKSYKVLCDIIPEFEKHFSLYQYCWVRCVVITRVFGIRLDGNKTSALVPFADLVDHGKKNLRFVFVYVDIFSVFIFVYNYRWTYNENSHMFEISAFHDIIKGEYFYISYGMKCNSRWLVNYGFIKQNNDPYNEATFYFKNNNNQNEMELFNMSISYKHNNVKECFSYLRSGIKGVPKFDPISIKDELIVLKRIQDASKYSLGLFNTTLKFDIELLKDYKKYPEFSNKRNAILMRKGEKEVLHYWFDLCETLIPILNISPNDVLHLDGNSFKDGEYVHCLQRFILSNQKKLINYLVGYNVNLDINVPL